MEPKFINQYQVTLEMLQYWTEHPVGKKAVKYRKVGIRLRITMLCCGLFLILSSVLTRELFFSIAGIIFIFIGLERLFLLPKISIKRQYALLLKAQNADALMYQFTFSEEIIGVSGNTQSRYAYADIINVTEDSEYFYLFYNEDMVLRIYKPGFILGTADEFRLFCRDFLKNREVQN